VTVAVIAVPRRDLPLALAFYGSQTARIEGTRRVYLLHTTDGPITPMAFHDLDGEPLVELRTFPSLDAARQWCQQQEVQ